MNSIHRTVPEKITLRRPLPPPMTHGAVPYVIPEIAAESLPAKSARLTPEVVAVIAATLAETLTLEQERCRPEGSLWRDAGWSDATSRWPKQAR